MSLGSLEASDFTFEFAYMDGHGVEQPIRDFDMAVSNQPLDGNNCAEGFRLTSNILAFQVASSVISISFYRVLRTLSLRITAHAVGSWCISAEIHATAAERE